MKNWILTKLIAFLGGVSGIVEMALKWFNENVLAKCTDKDEMAAYCTDIEELAAFLTAALDRHAKWMSEEKRAALTATIAAIRELAAAIKDANVSEDEFKAIVEKVKAAVDAWMEAK